MTKLTEEQYFEHVYGYLPRDVQQRLREMDDSDRGDMESNGIHPGVPPDQEHAAMLDQVMVEIAGYWRRMIPADLPVATPKWRYIADLTVDMAILAIGRARRQEAGLEPISTHYE